MKQYDVSVILPFRDHEEVIGTAVARLAAYLRQTGWSFELIAVDDDSRDNSQAVLALIRGQYPELRIIAASRGRGHAAGVGAARGQILWLIEPREALAPLTGFAPACERVRHGDRDLIAHSRFVIADRARASHALRSTRGYGSAFRQRVLQRTRHPARSRFTPRWVAPLLSALSPARIP